MKTQVGKMVVIGAMTLLAVAGAKAQSFNVFIGAPDDQSNPHSIASVETFNSWTPGLQNGLVSSPGLTAFSGTYNFTGNTGDITVADQYGGAGGTGNYVAMGNYWTGNDNPYSLTLGVDANYFGFWWSAGDANNNIQFYNDGVLLATFTSDHVVNALSGGGTILSVDNTPYNKSDYFGNPNAPFAGQNPSEPYAFVSIYATGLTFDEIRFDNGSFTSTGFESDNHTLFSGSLTPVGSQVFVTNLPVPEPGVTVLFGVASMGLLFFRRRRAIR